MAGSRAAEHQIPQRQECLRHARPYHLIRQICTTQKAALQPPVGAPAGRQRAAEIDDLGSAIGIDGPDAPAHIDGCGRRRRLVEAAGRGCRRRLIQIIERPVGGCRGLGEIGRQVHRHELAGRCMEMRLRRKQFRYFIAAYPPNHHIEPSRSDGFAQGKKGFAIIFPPRCRRIDIGKIAATERPAAIRIDRDVGDANAPDKLVAALRLPMLLPAGQQQAESMYAVRAEGARCDQSRDTTVQSPAYLAGDRTTSCRTAEHCSEQVFKGGFDVCIFLNRAWHHAQQRRGIIDGECSLRRLPAGDRPLGQLPNIAKHRPARIRKAEVTE